MLLKRALNKVIREMLWYKALFGDSIKFWGGFPFNLDVINLGSNSGKYAFNYSADQSIRGENWALGSQSLMHDFSILRNYFSYLKKGGTVLITLCPFSCLNVQYSKEHNLKYYTFLHPATIENFSEEERVKSLKLKADPFFSYPLLCFKGFISEIKSILYKIFHGRYAMNYQQNADNFIKMWKKQFGINDLNAELSSEHLSIQIAKAKILSEMISFCLERDLNPILIIPPVHPALSNFFTPKFKKNYIYNFVEKANTCHVPFLNYMDSSDFTDDSLFTNSFFLSEKGAILFTEDVMKKLGIVNN